MNRSISGGAGLQPCPRLLCAALALAAVSIAEPAPRRLPPAPLRLDTPLAHVSAVGELADGRLVITDAKRPSVLLLNPSTGSVSPLGAPGTGPGQYARPGGLYAGADGTTLLLDRGLARVLVISPAGAILGSRSIAVRGVTSASDSDLDMQRVDAKGLAYFVERGMIGRDLLADPPKEDTLVRFDAATQKREPVAQLLKPESRRVPGGDGVILGRAVIGSPADGWGVAPDGRVAVVRAAPYRVEWFATDGRVTRGPIVEYDPLPMTDADRAAFAASRGRGPSAGLTGGSNTDAGRLGLQFAATKPPFHPDDVIVAPDGHVWVMRSRPIDSQVVVYDVFDGAAKRSDRIEWPAGSRVAGFGASAVYVRACADAGPCALTKYRLR